MRYATISLMERLSIAHCRKLIGQTTSPSLPDEDVLQLRDTLYALGEVIADAFADLNSIDQSTFDPPDDFDDWLREISGGPDVE